MRIFGAERITGLMERLGMEEDVPIEHGLINRAIENAQKKVEGHNFDIRKNLLEYDDVMNQQRKTIYALRRQILEGRYAPEPTEEEKKKEKERGIAPRETPLPTESGKFTVEGLSAAVRPILARMCDALSESRTADAEAPGGFKVQTVPVNAAHLRSLIYREWGAYPDTSGVVEDRTATLDRLAEDVASSLIQQRERVLDLSEQMIQLIIDEHCPPGTHAEEWDIEALSALVKQCFGFQPSISDAQGLDWDSLAEMLWEQVERVIEARETEYPLHILMHYTRLFYLEEIDQRWIEHLKSMEALREGIHLRGYGQKDPKQEYKKEGFVIFGEMMNIIGRNVCEKLFNMQLQRVDAQGARAAGRRRPARRIAAARLGAAVRRQEAAPDRRIRRWRRGAGPAADERRRQRRRREADAPDRTQGGAQRSLPLRKRQEIQEMPRRRRDGLTREPSEVSRTLPRRPRWAKPSSVHAILTALSTLALAGAGAGCQADLGTAGCQVTQQTTLPGSPLTLLKDVRLDVIGSNYALIGHDPVANAIRWATLDATSGTMGAEHAYGLPMGVQNPLFALAAAPVAMGQTPVPGDTVLIGYVGTDTTGTKGELAMIAVPANGLAPAGPAAIIHEFPAGVPAPRPSPWCRRAKACTPGWPGSTRRWGRSSTPPSTARAPWWCPRRRSPPPCPASSSWSSRPGRTT